MRLCDRFPVASPCFPPFLSVNCRIIACLWHLGASVTYAIERLCDRGFFCVTGVFYLSVDFLRWHLGGYYGIAVPLIYLNPSGWREGGWFVMPCVTAGGIAVPLIC